jgi:predicted ATPase
LRRLGDDTYSRLLFEHREIVRAALLAHDGVDRGTQGDSFFASFTSPREGVAAAIEIQRALAEHVWPHDERLRVRMGIHTGEAMESREGFTGFEVHRAARIAAVSHGGQVLLSESTAALVRDAMPFDASLKDLGWHRLKDLGRREHLYQLMATGLDAEFPALRSLDNPELPNNLPATLTPFVGRAKELEEVRTLIAGSRVVTLVGTGGSGKTRLALQVAAELLDGSGDGVWLVELASVQDPDQVPSAVLRSLELREEWDQSALDTLVAALRDQDVLLLLDNCEHLIDAVAKLAEFVCRHCPKVRVVATSREPLMIEGECVYRVPSLSLPPDEVDSVEALEGSDAARLFVTRAHSYDRAFLADDDNAPLIASICRRLDGIALAIELAAARVPLMSLAELDQRLDQRFRLLSEGHRTSPPRQQTLRAAVAWSYDMLVGAERTLLHCLSVFVSGFDLEAVEGVCDTLLEGGSTADVLGSLVNKSLVVADRTPSSTRFRLLETIREFALEQLLEHDGEERLHELQRLHAAYYLRLGERAEPELVGPRQSVWLRRLDDDLDNLVAAFGSLADDGSTEQVLRLGIATSAYFGSRFNRAPIGHVESALEGGANVPIAVRARALVTLARLMNAVLPSDQTNEMASELCEEAIRLSADIGDKATLALGEVTLSHVSRRSGNAVRAKTLADEAMAVAKELDDARLMGLAAFAQGYAQTSLIEGRRFFDVALTNYRRAGDLSGICLTLIVLAAGTYTDLEQVRGAIALEDEAMGIAEEIGSTSLLIGLWINRGVSSFLLGDVGAAREYARRVLVTGRRLGESMWTLPAVFVLSCCEAVRGDPEGAARLVGAYERITDDAPDWEWSPLEVEMRDNARARLIETLGQPSFERAVEEGRRLSVEQVADLALGRVRPSAAA